MSALEERLRKSTPTRMREKIVPSSDWTEDYNAHYLLVDLPGTAILQHLIVFLNVAIPLKYAL